MKSNLQFCVLIQGVCMSYLCSRSSRTLHSRKLNSYIWRSFQLYRYHIPKCSSRCCCCFEKCTCLFIHCAVAVLHPADEEGPESDDEEEEDDNDVSPPIKLFGHWWINAFFHHILYQSIPWFNTATGLYCINKNRSEQQNLRMGEKWDSQKRNTSYLTPLPNL